MSYGLEAVLTNSLCNSSKLIIINFKKPQIILICGFFSEFEIVEFTYLSESPVMSAFFSLRHEIYMSYRFFRPPIFCMKLSMSMLLLSLMSLLVSPGV